MPMERPWSNEDILRERKRASEAYDQGYRKGFSAGYRKARVEILGEESVSAEEQAYNELVDGIIAEITKTKGTSGQ